MHDILFCRTPELCHRRRDSSGFQRGIILAEHLFLARGFIGADRKVISGVGLEPFDGIGPLVVSFGNTQIAVCPRLALIDHIAVGSLLHRPCQPHRIATGAVKGKALYRGRRRRRRRRRCRVQRRRQRNQQRQYQRQYQNTQRSFHVLHTLPVFYLLFSKNAD